MELFLFGKCPLLRALTTLPDKRNKLVEAYTVAILVSYHLACPRYLLC